MHQLTLRLFRSQSSVLHGPVVLPHHIRLKSNDCAFLYFCTQNYFSFIGIAAKQDSGDSSFSLKGLKL